MPPLESAKSVRPGGARPTSRSLTQKEADEFLAAAAARLRMKFGPPAPDASAAAAPAAAAPAPLPQASAMPPAAPLRALQTGFPQSPPQTGTPREPARRPDAPQWAGIVRPPDQPPSSEVFYYLCRECNAIFDEQPIIRRSSVAYTIQCPRCQRHLLIEPGRKSPVAARNSAPRPAPAAPSGRSIKTPEAAKADPGTPLRAAAEQKAASPLKNWLGDVPPRDYGARLMEVLIHPDARRLAKELHLFRPRAFLGIGPSAPTRPPPSERPVWQSPDSRSAAPVSIDPVRLAALIDFRRLLHGHAADGSPGQNAELIHRGTSASCGCGRPLRFETTGSRDGELRLAASGGRATHADCNFFSTVRLSVLNQDLKAGLAGRLSSPAWARCLFRSLAKILRRARAHHRRASADIDHQPAADGQLIPYNGPLDPLPSARKLNALLAEIRQLPRAQTPHVVSPPIKLAIRVFARQLERRRLRRGISETDFLERCAMTAGLLSTLPGASLQLDRLVDSLVIRTSAAAPRHPGRLRARVALNLREFLKLILPATWHPVIDQFAKGLLRIEIPVGDPPTADALLGPVQKALSLGQTQYEIARDFGISQSQVSILTRAPAPEIPPTRKASLPDRARIRLAERRAEIRRWLTPTPAPGTGDGDNARLRRLSEGLKRYKAGLCPFSEAVVPSTLVPSTLQAARNVSLADGIGPVATPGSDAQPAARGSALELLTILPLQAEDVSLARSLLARRSDPAAAGAPDELWRRLQAHAFDGDPRPTCRPDQRFAMRQALATLKRFSRGQIEAGDPVVGALILRELGGWVPLLMDALEVAGYSSWETAPRLGLGPGVVQVSKGLWGAAQTPDWLSAAQRTAMDQLRALLLGAARKGRDPFHSFLASMKSLGRLPATVQLGPALHFDHGQLLADEIVFQRAWIAPTDRNRTRLDKLERRLAEMTGGRPNAAFAELLAALATGALPRSKPACSNSAAAGEAKA